MYGSYKKEHCWILYSSAHAPEFFSFLDDFFPKKMSLHPKLHKVHLWFMVALWICQVPSISFQ